MVTFKELRITPGGEKLIIDVSISDLPYYDNIYLDAIIIDTQDTYVANGSSKNPIFNYELDSTDKKRRVRLELDSNTVGVSLDNTLFFIYIVTKGVPSADTPCGMDNQTTMEVVANLYPFYRSAINYMKDVEAGCVIPKYFIDALLRFKALELSIKTGHYVQAIKFWNKFFKDTKTETVNTKCKCYGQS